MGNPRWSNFTSVFRETDLWIAVDSVDFVKDIERYTHDRILFYRKLLDEHINYYPVFRDSLDPLSRPGALHPILSGMYEASKKAGTGPMSTVAGAMAQFICTDVITEFKLNEMVAENGGDIFMKICEPAEISVYAGDSPLSGKINLVIKPEDTPLAVCCSSGTSGHSLSFGVADACMIACRSGALADAYATAFCNKVINKEIMQELAEQAVGTGEILSVVIIKDDKVALGGSLEIRI
jgi:ApbE superfamily uncharacterized protein (UPF0280 family)